MMDLIKRRKSKENINKEIVELQPANDYERVESDQNKNEYALHPNNEEKNSTTEENDTAKNNYYGVPSENLTNGEYSRLEKKYNNVEYSNLIDFNSTELEIQKEIGKGNFGSVLLETGKDKKVALKSLNDESKREEMNKEISVLAKFDHPNIVKFLGIAYKNKTQYIVMEYINGGDLRSIWLNKLNKEREFHK